jgi:hypothetical protein
VLELVEHVFRARDIRHGRDSAGAGDEKESS